jgi:hypothetical protein
MAMERSRRMKGVMLECHRETVVVAVPGTMREWPMDLAVVKMGRWANTVMVRTVLAKTVPTLGKRATTLVARVTLVGQMMARCQVKVHTREEHPDQRAPVMARCQVKVHTREELPDRRAPVLVRCQVKVHTREELPDRRAPVLVRCQVKVHTREELPDRRAPVLARCQVKVHTREELPDRRALTLVARVTPWAKTTPVMVKLVLLLALPALRVVTAPAKVAKA